MASRSETATIRRVQGRKNYHALADYLREQILSGCIPEGAPLPNERDLGGQAGLSCGSVREALRVLEVEGLVFTRPGRNGGSTTRRPGPAGVTRSLAALIRRQRIPFDAVREAREVLEPALAALAAMNRSDADLDEIAAAGWRSWRPAASMPFSSPPTPAGTGRWLGQAETLSWWKLVAAVGDLLDWSNVERFVSAEVRDAVIRMNT